MQPNNPEITVSKNGLQGTLALVPSSFLPFACQSSVPPYNLLDCHFCLQQSLDCEKAPNHNFSPKMVPGLALKIGSSLQSMDTGLNEAAIQTLRGDAELW